MWIWLVTGLVLFYLLIFANQSKKDASEKTPKKKSTSLQLGEINDRYMELFDEDDELLEEFLIIDLLDEEEEEL